VTWWSESESIAYRLLERDAQRKSRQLDAFVETTAIAGLTLRLTMLSILDDPQLRERRVYSSYTERSEWRPGHWVLFSMSGSF
jgi:hypothetical protein